MPRRLGMLLVLFAALTSTATGTGATGSGLRGVVLRGPTTPVCRAGVPCTAPAAHTVLVFQRNGRVVRTTTDAYGRYRIALPPGDWAISLATPLQIGRGIEPRHARVRGGAFRSVDLAIDTGIR